MTLPRSGYSRTAIVLHWLMALLLVGNFAGGLLMGNLFDSHDPATRELGPVVAQLHKSLGLTILMLSLLRLGVRLANGVPPLPDHMTSVERLLSKITHWGFYAVMILVPLSGWVMISANPQGAATVWFGLFEWPQLPIASSKDVAGAASETHEILAFMGAGLLVLHIGAALKHQYFDSDDVLARMLPFLRQDRS